MNDSEFLRALEEKTLPRDAFNHRSHLRAAWLYLERDPLPIAALNCARSIQEYANALGATDKFHLTMTLAFMHIVADRRQKLPAADWESFINSNADLQANGKEILARYYSEAVLASDTARRSFQPPDREPLPIVS